MESNYQETLLISRQDSLNKNQGQTMRIPQEMAAMKQTFSVLESGITMKFEEIFQRGKNIAPLHGGVPVVTFSPDGKYLARGGYDGMIIIWDTANYSEFQSFTHTNAVVSLGYTMDNKYLFAGTHSQFSFWDTEKYEKQFTLEGLGNWIRAADISPDGKTIAAGDDDGLIKVWNYIEKTEIVTIKEFSMNINCLKFSQNARYMISGSDNCRGVIWNLVENKVEYLIKSINSIKFVNFTPDSKYYILGSYLHAALYNMKTHEEIFKFSGHTNWVLSLTFMKNQKYLIVSSADKTIKVWNFKKRLLLFTLAGHTDEIKGLAVHPNLYMITSSDLAGNIKVWDFTQAKEDYEILAFNREVRCARFSPDNKILATSGMLNGTKLWNAETYDLLTELTYTNCRIWSLEFTHDMKWLIAGGEDFTLTLISLENYETSKILPSFPDRILSIALSKDSKTVFCSLANSQIHAVSIESKSITATMSGHSSAVWGIAISPDNYLLASGSGDFLVKLWDIASANEIFTFKGHTEAIRAVCFTLDSKKLISSSNDKSIRIWSIENKTEEFSFLGHKNNIIALALSVDGRFLASSSWDNTVKVWNLEEKREEFTLSGHKSYVYTVAFSSDGKKLVSGSDDGVVKLWNVNELMEDLNMAEGLSLKNERYQNFWQFYNTLYSLSTKQYSNISVKNCKIFVTRYCFTTLHLLAYIAAVDKIQEMITANKIVYLADSFGHSAFYYSIKRQNQNITDLLLQNLISTIYNSDSSKLMHIFNAFRNDIQLIIENSSKYLDAFLSLSIYCKLKAVQFGVPLSQLPLYTLSTSDYPDLGLFVGPKQSEGNLPLMINTVPFKFPSAFGSPSSISFLKAILSCKNEDIYRTEFIQFFVQCKWDYLYYWILSYTALLWMNLLQLLLFIKYESIYFALSFAGVNLLLLIWELFQWSQTGREYITDAWNLVDLTRVAFTYLWIAFVYFGVNFYAYELGWVVILLSIIRGITGFRAFDTTRFYIRLIFQSLLGIKSFLFIFVYTTLSFGLMHIAASNLSKSEITFESLWMDSFGLAIGDSENMKSSHLDLNYLTFFIAIVINLILMLNLIISLLGDSFDQFQLMAEIYNYTEMIEVVLEIEQIKSLASPSDQYEYLHICSHAYKTEGFWKGKVLDSQESMRKLERKVNESIKLNTSGMATMENNLVGEIAEIFEKVKLIDSDIKSSINNVDDKVANLQSKMEAIEGKTLSKIEAIESKTVEKMEAIESKMEGIESKIEGMESKMDTILQHLIKPAFE